MSKEAQARLRLVLTILTWIIKTGQWQLALSLVLMAIKARLTWLEFMGRLDGTYYAKQVSNAVAEYKRKTKWTDKPNVSGVKGMQSWIDRNKPAK